MINETRRKSARSVFPSVLACHERLIGEQPSLVECRAVVPPELEDLFDDTVVGPDVEQIAAWCKTLRDIPATADAGDLDGKTWCDVTTKRINLIKGVEDQITERAVAEAEALRSAIWTHIYLLSAGLAVLVAAIAGFGVPLSFRIARQIRLMTRSVKTLAAGDRETVVPQTDRTDKIGAMARAIESFRNALRRSQALEAKQQRAWVEGISRTKRLTDEMTASETDFSNLLSNFRSISEDLQLRPSGLPRSAQTSSAQAGLASAASARSAANVRTVAAAELNASINEIVHQMQQQVLLTGAAIPETTRSSEAVNNLSREPSKSPRFSE